MRKVLSALINNILIVVLPLVFKPWLIINYKILIIVFVVICIWMTQPAFSIEETKREKDNDKLSVILILIMSMISIIVPTIDWAYFQSNQNYFGIMEWLAIFFICVGLTFRVWAIKRLGIFFTPTVRIQDNQTLITNGPYTLIRHPSYFGAFLCITSGALILNSIIGYVTACCCMGYAYYFRIKAEEKKLVMHFGSLYKAYMQKTKMIIPYIL